MDNEIQDYGAMFRVSDYILTAPNAEEYVKEQVRRIEKDAIYAAVKQAESTGGWICIKPELTEFDDFPMMQREFRVKVHCRPVEYGRIYVPVYEQSSMPIDVHKCTWCGGYTKNDMRGHCSGCGGPRNEEYLEGNT